MATAAACGIELDVGPAAPGDGGLPVDTSSSSGSSSSSGDATTSSSSSSGTVASSSSSSSGSIEVDAGPDAEAPDPCTGEFAFGAAEIVQTDPCTSSPTTAACAGAARRDNDRLLLTIRDTVMAPQAGVYWRKLGLGRNARFRLVANVTTQQPNGGGIPGHGFAFAFTEDDDATPGFPTVRQEEAARLGINRLPGFHGGAGYVQTYDGGNDGVLALRATAIPSGIETAVDGWNTGSDNAETFGRNDRTFLRFVIDGVPNQAPSVQMYRLTSESDPTPRLIETRSIALPAMERFDYFGVAASRGRDDHSQSGHWLTSLVLTCPAP